MSIFLNEPDFWSASLRMEFPLKMFLLRINGFHFPHCNLVCLFNPPPLAHSSGLQSTKVDPGQWRQTFYSLGMTNYSHFQQELHAEVNFLRLQRTIAFTLRNEVTCYLLHAGVNGDFLLTWEIFYSGSTGNWRICYEQEKPPDHSFGRNTVQFSAQHHIF